MLYWENLHRACQIEFGHLLRAKYKSYIQVYTRITLQCPNSTLQVDQFDLLCIHCRSPSHHPSSFLNWCAVAPEDSIFVRGAIISMVNVPIRASVLSACNEVKHILLSAHPRLGAWNSSIMHTNFFQVWIWKLWLPICVWPVAYFFFTRVELDGQTDGLEEGDAKDFHCSW